MSAPSERRSPMVHLICGFLGAGKTHFSRELSARSAAVRFCMDELYLQLFTDGPTLHLDRAAWARVERMLAELWPQLSRAGVDVVLDCGFWSRAQRDEARALARAAGADAVLYWLQCADDVALRRCLARNGSPGAFLISEQGFFELKSRFEPPGPDESVQVVDSGVERRD